ncbi:MAG: flagellar hook-associated protein FlgK [Ilumatobacter sp.]|uniref:flagellar hook-associated protein FlgK n=1 Tax=Ilumatobacter sp. TaxID=1967498 RepID=UPI00262B82D6|nr:flagellar hook-associated protein FlgK [Ilumatobacter sp.]MDJ0767429.1 flagellar hook-associated protein FlgK [Ilumatobacter sp.]
MPNISGLYTALSGMNAQRRVLDVTAHNVANQATPGYHRQRVELSPVGFDSVSALHAGQGTQVAGVEIDGVIRVMDQLAENRLLRETGSQGGTTTLRTHLGRIEQVFPEPSEDGLAALLDDFWGGWNDLTSRPADTGVRAQLLERAGALADGLQRSAAGIESAAATAREEIGRLAADVNAIAARVAELNGRIAASPNAVAANDLRDQRDLFIRDLAESTGVVARETEAGHLDLYVGGRALVNGSYVHEMDGSSGVLRWVADGTDVTAPPSKAAALTQTVGEVVPSYLAMLDDVAARLVADVNTLHASGYDPSGTSGRDFFDPAGITAATISLSADVDGQPERIAAGAPVFPGPTAPGPLDGEQARAIAALADSTSGPDTAYRSLVARLGVDVRAAIRRDDVQSRMTASTEAEAASVGGVSLDEEMANLVAAQRAYEASARVLTTVDELLGVLIERTGRVGR